MNRARVNGLSEGRPKDFSAFWRQYTSWIRFRDLGVDPDRCIELLSDQPNASFQAIFSAVLLAFQERVGKERVGEKSPSHVRYLRELFDWYPDAQILVMQRDPRAVVASQLGTHYVRNQQTPVSLRRGLVVGKRIQQVAHYANDWAEVYDEVLSNWTDDPRVEMVPYEALVAQPEKQLRKICTFLNEQFEPRMLVDRSSRTVRVPVSREEDPEFEAWRRKHQEKALSRITTNSLDKWKNQLTTWEVAIIEGRTEHVMPSLGYAPSLVAYKCAAGRILSGALLRAAASEARARQSARAMWHRLRAEPSR